MANYFLPSGEKFEYGMKEKSMASVKVWKEYALEVGIKETDWDKGVNKAVEAFIHEFNNGQVARLTHYF